jgi:hypothetical protein
MTPSRWQRALFVLSLALMAVPTLRLGTGGIGLLPEHLGVPLLVLLLLARTRTPRVSTRPSLGIVVGLLLVFFWWFFTLVASLFVAPDPPQSLRLMTWVAANIILCVLVYSLRDMIPSSLVPLAWVLIVLMAINLAGWALAQGSGQLNDFVEADYATSIFRAKGLFLEPNLYAAFVTLAMAAMYVWSRVIPQGLYWFFAALAGVSVFLTFTRVAWVAFALLLGASLIKFLYRRPIAQTFSVLALIAVLVAAVLNTDAGPATRSGDPLFDATLGRITGLLNTEQGTGYTRVLTIDSALSDLTAMHSWWTGFGFNGYSQVHDAGVTSYARAYLPTLWIAIFYDGGILAGTCFILAVVIWWFSSRRAGGTLFFLSFALLAGATNNIWFAFPWVFGAIIIAASRNPHVHAAPITDTLSAIQPRGGLSPTKLR